MHLKRLIKLLLKFLLEVFWWKYLCEIVIFKEKKNRVAISMVFAIVSHVYITAFEKNARAALKKSTWATSCITAVLTLVSHRCAHRRIGDKFKIAEEQTFLNRVDSFPDVQRATHTWHHQHMCWIVFMTWQRNFTWNPTVLLKINSLV